jgi:hypothetical protein
VNFFAKAALFSPATRRRVNFAARSSESARMRSLRPGALGYCNSLSLALTDQFPLELCGLDQVAESVFPLPACRQALSLTHRNCRSLFPRHISCTFVSGPIRLWVEILPLAEGV